MIVITMVTSDWSWQDRSVRSCDVEPLLLLLFFKFLFTSNFIVKSEEDPVVEHILCTCSFLSSLS